MNKKGDNKKIGVLVFIVGIFLIIIGMFLINLNNNSNELNESVIKYKNIMYSIPIKIQL